MWRELIALNGLTLSETNLWRVHTKTDVDHRARADNKCAQADDVTPFRRAPLLLEFEVEVVRRLVAVLRERSVEEVAFRHIVIHCMWEGGLKIYTQ